MSMDDGRDTREARNERRRERAEAAARADGADDDDDVRDDLHGAKADLAAIVVAHPVGAVAAAVGVGYLVGGGLFTRLTSRVLRLGLRLGLQFAVLPALEQEMATLVGLGKATSGADDSPPPRDRRDH
jgi:hypothetical protein